MSDSFESFVPAHAKTRVPGNLTKKNRRFSFRVCEAFSRERELIDKVEGLPQRRQSSFLRDAVMRSFLESAQSAHAEAHKIKDALPRPPGKGARTRRLFFTLSVHESSELALIEHLEHIPLGRRREVLRAMALSGATGRSHETAGQKSSPTGQDAFRQNAMDGEIHSQRAIGAPTNTPAPVERNAPVHPNARADQATREVSRPTQPDAHPAVRAQLREAAHQDVAPAPATVAKEASALAGLMGGLQPRRAARPD